MFEKIKSFVLGVFTHLFSGCSVCAEFARHIAKTVVQILKGSDNYKKS